MLANHFVDAFAVLSFGSPVAAFEFNVLTLDGLGGVGGPVDITLLDDQLGATVYNSVTVGAGRNLGILGINNMNLVSIEILDPNDGFEGIQGQGIVYSTVSAPEPGTIALLLVGVVGVAARRRSFRQQHWRS